MDQLKIGDRVVIEMQNDHHMHEGKEGTISGFREATDDGITYTIYFLEEGYQDPVHGSGFLASELRKI